MKTLSKTLLCVCGLTLFPLIVSAANNKAAIPEYELKKYQVADLTLPVPEKVVAPRFNGLIAGKKVRMKLTVGTDGRARNISQEGFSFDQHTNSLAIMMQKVLKQWRFEPALDKAGNAVAVKVILPVKVVKDEGNADKYARITVAKPIFLARVN